MTDALVVLTNLPDEATAHALASHLVESRLAACVNVLAPCRSVYRWQGALEEAAEVPLLIKTSAERYAALEAAIRARHPYELPEILAVPVMRGLPAYLDWVAAETALASTGSGQTPLSRPDADLGSS
jgi:periplasmic divalent cation tolerance protein